MKYNIFKVQNISANFLLNVFTKIKYIILYFCSVMLGVMLVRPVGNFYSSLSYYLKMELKPWQQRGGGEGIAQYRVHNLLPLIQ